MSRGEGQKSQRRHFGLDSTTFLKIKFIYLFIYFWLCWVFVAARRLSLVAVSRGYSSLWCTGFSLRWLLLRSTGSRHVGFSSCSTRASVVAARGLSSCGSRALERRLSSCGARALLLCSMWDLPRPGLKPVCPALADGFLTSAPPGKSLDSMTFEACYNLGDKCFCDCLASGSGSAYLFSLLLPDSESAITWA